MLQKRIDFFSILVQVQNPLLTILYKAPIFVFDKNIIHPLPLYIMLLIQRIPINSSMLNAIAYDKKTQTLVAEFNNGVIWAYYEVPSDYYELMLKETKSGSVGRYMHHFILGNFTEQELWHGHDFRWQ